MRNRVVHGNREGGVLPANRRAPLPAAEEVSRYKPPEEGLPDRPKKKKKKRGRSRLTDQTNLRGKYQLQI
jgi:hypothetical protein